VSQATVFLAKLIGLFMMIVGLAIGLHEQQSIASIEALAQAPQLLLVVGLITLVAGLAIVLRHNIWSGGVLPIVITLLGWIIVARALLLLFLSSKTLPTLLTAIRFERFFYGYAVVIVAIGILLTYAGFASKTLAVESPKP